MGGLAVEGNTTGYLKCDKRCYCEGGYGSSYRRRYYYSSYRRRYDYSSYRRRYYYSSYRRRYEYSSYRRRYEPFSNPDTEPSCSGQMICYYEPSICHNALVRAAVDMPKRGQADIFIDST